MPKPTFEEFCRELCGVCIAGDGYSIDIHQVRARKLYNSLTGGEVVAELGPYDYYEELGAWRHSDGLGVDMGGAAAYALGPNGDGRYLVRLVRVPREG